MNLEEARQVISDCDREMVALFERRMAAVREVAAYKMAEGLPVLDATREAEVLARNVALLSDQTLAREYTAFQNGVMGVSRAYQHRLMGDLYVNVGEGYDIRLSPGGLASAGKYMNLNRRVLIVTDSGVPTQYANAIAVQCKKPVVATIPQGEGSKNFTNFEKLSSILVQHSFDRHDCVVAVGGGVVGDLAGFVAASYMRGIDFYNVPTTLLSQVDSSIGGKVAVDFHGMKNIIGAFKQPKMVLIDPSVLATLSRRQYVAGLAEVIKMAATHDPVLFERLEREGLETPALDIIDAALRIKRGVVEEDEKETGLRRVLNFGHTVGHGIESRSGGQYMHGECVALGMLPMCAPAVRERLLALYEKVGLPTEQPYATDLIWGIMMHDKKMAGDTITYVWVEEIGSFEIRTASRGDYYNLVKEGLGR